MPRNTGYKVDPFDYVHNTGQATVRSNVEPFHHVTVKVDCNAHTFRVFIGINGQDVDSTPAQAVFEYPESARVLLLSKEKNLLLH